MGQGESHPSVLLLCWGTSDENTCSSGSDVLVQGWGATEVSPHGFANSELGQAGWGTELGRRCEEGFHVLESVAGVQMFSPGKL